MKQRHCWIVMVALVSAPVVCAAGPVTSGPKVGARPGPYTFWVSTGANRGQETCFICETADRPAVIVFARTPSDGLGKLARKLDKALNEHHAADLKSWITFIGKEHVNFDRNLLDWSRQHGIKTVPVGSFKESDGPPTYQVVPEADVTVVLFVKRKVHAVFAFRASELTEEAVARVGEAIPLLVNKAK